MGTAAETINATAANIIEHLHGDLNQTFQLADARPVAEFVRTFETDADDAFVGRDAVFDALDAFAEHNPAGYFEIVGAAGLGKTALAGEIARRKDAVVFLASAGDTHRPDQFLEHTSAALIIRHGLGHAALPKRAGDDATFLVQILRESAERAGKPVWIVVDALDEADPPPAGANPLLLPPRLPAGVYVVVTRRTGQLLTSPNTPLHRYTLSWNDPLQAADLAEFIRARVAGDHRIAGALAKSDPRLSTEAFVSRLLEAGEGNFMYVSYVLADIAEADADAPPLDLGDLPARLEGYYDQFWQRMSPSQSQDWADWTNLYEPVIERLAVAREAVTADWLGEQVGRPGAEVRIRVLEPWARVLSKGKRNGWRLFHRTFGEYLETRLDMRDAHRKVALSYVERLWGKFDHWDAYGLRYTATHLAEAADRASGPERHDLIAQLARLVTAHAFQLAHLAALRDPTLLRRDLGLARRLVAGDDHDDATFLLVSVALTDVLLHRQTLRPEAIFEAAREGDVPAAERLLDAYSGDLDGGWHDAILLTAAWLAAGSAPAEARSIRNRIRDTAPNDTTLARLLERVSAAIEGDPVPSQTLGPAPSPPEAEAIVARIGGSADTSMLAGINPELMAGELGLEGGYLSTLDGPPLVALAVKQPPYGDRVLDRYLDVHRAYGYPQYRNGSLWELLPAVLSHPTQDWVRDRLAQIALVVLAAPNRGEFLEGLEIAVLALQARAGDGGAASELRARREAAVAEASALPPSPVRGQGDVWAVHRRRLAALAEAYHVLAPGAGDAAELAAMAVAVGQGFAGITAPACLTMAETASLVAPMNGILVDRALESAEQAAHNIQDFTFCARTTARVAAMRQRWWPGPTLDPTAVRAVVGRLSPTQSTREFAALHVIGEQYAHREPQSRNMMPPWMLTARTLEELAAVYKRPVEDFERLNEARGWRVDQVLPFGTVVDVPDPGFPPLIAARLSAAVLSSAAPPPVLGMQLRALVLATGADVTTLGTVLTRSLLCSPTWDVVLLIELRRLVSTAAATIPSVDANINLRMPF